MKANYGYKDGSGDFFITIDTEEDNCGEYRRAYYDVENINMLPQLQQILDNYGAKPTYLVSWAVVNTLSSQKVLETAY